MRECYHILSICNNSQVHFHVFAFLGVVTAISDLKYSKLANLAVWESMEQTKLSMNE
jgi:hypothetical protein